jgi:hypothetical protein
VPTVEQQRLAELEREVRELRRANETSDLLTVLGRLPG